MPATLDASKVRYQIARYMTINNIGLREATIACATAFTRVARDNGHDSRLCLLLGETITKIGAEWAAELAVEAATK